MDKGVLAQPSFGGQACAPPQRNKGSDRTAHLREAARTGRQHSRASAQGKGCGRLARAGAGKAVDDGWARLRGGIADFGLAWEQRAFQGLQEGISQRARRKASEIWSNVKGAVAVVVVAAAKDFVEQIIPWVSRTVAKALG
jgi:hypothetical protein